MWQREEHLLPSQCSDIAAGGTPQTFVMRWQDVDDARESKASAHT